MKKYQPPISRKLKKQEARIKELEEQVHALTWELVRIRPSSRSYSYWDGLENPFIIEKLQLVKKGSWYAEAVLKKEKECKKPSTTSRKKDRKETSRQQTRQANSGQKA